MCNMGDEGRISLPVANLLPYLDVLLEGLVHWSAGYRPSTQMQIQVQLLRREPS